MKYFERLHPSASFLYFIIVILIAMLTMNPVIVLICYFSGVIFCTMLIGMRKLLSSLSYSLPITIIIALTNPLFVHRGSSILFFLNDNPVTLEAIVYGCACSLMIMSVFYWCRCYSEIMTSDKFIYLFGRIIPKLSLVLSMALAFIPKFKQKFKEIDEAQKALGIYATKSYVDKIRSKFRVLSILLTYSLENSVQTADSMRARGYGLKGRSSYSIFKFTLSDLIFVIAEVLFGVCVLAFIISGNAKFYYYPSFSPLNTSISAYVMYSALIMLTGSSILLEVKENILWHCLKSKI